jgi:alpha-glucoside transport system substrate-binding protein
VTANGCTKYAPYQGHSGTTVTIFGAALSPDSTPLIASFSEFERCTGIAVEYEGSDDFVAQLPARLNAGSPPDLAVISGPHMLASLVSTGAVKKPPLPVSADVDRYFGPAWKQAGSVDGTFYAAPLGAQVKSLVWYSPKSFGDAGYQVPTSWATLMSLTDKIAADHPDTKPWCGGLGAGADTGWPATDWLEEVVLGKYGAGLYDSWVSHELAFDSPQIKDALRIVANWMANPRYVNGGFGDPETVATTTADDAGKPIVSGRCWMLQQGSGYLANWPAGTKVGPDGDVFAFQLPALDPKMPAPVEVTGTFAVAFADRPEVQAVQTYLSSAQWATSRVQAGGNFLSANTGVQPSQYADPLDQLAATLLTAPGGKGATVRYDASELMPAAVGAVTEPRELTNWFGTGGSIGQDAAIDAVTQAIDAAWPARPPTAPTASTAATSSPAAR